MPPWVIFARDYSVQLDTIAVQLERMIKQMSEMEARLDTVITGLQGTVSQVVTLVGQVLAKLEEAGTDVDLSDETTALEGLQADLQSAVENMQANVGGDETTGEPLVPADHVEESAPTEEPPA